MNKLICNLLSLLIVAFLIGCRPLRQIQQEEVHLNILKYPIITNPTTLDPGKVGDIDTYDAISQCVDTLVAFGEDHQLHPHLIEEMPTLENNNKTYVFKLKKGIKFHNGKELTAEDVKWTIERNTDPKFASPTARGYLNDIKGVTERLNGQYVPIGVEIRDKHTISFTLAEPKGSFLRKLTFPVAAPLCKNSVPETEIFHPEQLIATGPFILKEYMRDGHILLKANKNYFQGKPKINGILRPIVKDTSTRFNMYRNNQIDILLIDRLDIEAVNANPDLKKQLHIFNRPSTCFISLTIPKKAAFKDKKVLNAINMAIDKNHITSDILKNAAIPANSFLAPGVSGYRNDNRLALKYNPEEAKRLLANTEYSSDKKELSISLYLRGDKIDMKHVAENIQAQLRKNLGINIKICPIDFKSFLEIRNKKRADALYMRWVNVLLDPENSISNFFTTKGSQNFSGYSHPNVDALCKKADSSSDQAKRIKLYKQAEDIILSTGSSIPIYFEQDAFLIKPNIQGIRDSLVYILPHTKVTIN